MVYVVHYEIIGPAEAPETGVSSSFQLLEYGDEDGGDVPTVRTLREGWPYQGRFHFRAKVPCPTPEGYAWLDLSDEDAPLPVWSGEGAGGGSAAAGPDRDVHVRALPLALPNTDEAGATQEGAVAAAIGHEEELDYSGGDLDDDIMEAAYGGGGGGSSSGGGRGGGSGSFSLEGSARGGGAGGTWSQQVKEATEAVLTSDVARDLTKKGIKAGKIVGKQVNKLFKMAMAAAEGGASASSSSSSGYTATPACPSSAAIRVLQSLEEAVARSPNADLLQGLWVALFPGAGPFAARSPQWRAAGFSGDDPLPDLKGTGTLCVQCVIHLASRYPAKLRDLLRAQVYPFAAAANEVAFMLIDLFKLRDGRYLNAHTVFWGIFEGGGAAPAVEEIFALALAHLDRELAEATGAAAPPREDLSRLVQATRRRLESVLGQAPATFAEFCRLADACGLYIE